MSILSAIYTLKFLRKLVNLTMFKNTMGCFLNTLWPQFRILQERRYEFLCRAYKRSGIWPPGWPLDPQPPILTKSLDLHTTSATCRRWRCPDPGIPPAAMRLFANMSSCGLKKVMQDYSMPRWERTKSFMQCIETMYTFVTWAGMLDYAWWVFVCCSVSLRSQSFLWSLSIRYSMYVCYMRYDTCSCITRMKHHGLWRTSWPSLHQWCRCLYCTRLSQYCPTFRQERSRFLPPEFLQYKHFADDCPFYILIK